MHMPIHSRVSQGDLTEQSGEQISSWGTGIDAGLPQPKLLLRQGDGGEGQSRYQTKAHAGKETYETDLTQSHPT